MGGPGQRRRSGQGSVARNSFQCGATCELLGSKIVNQRVHVWRQVERVARVNDRRSFVRFVFCVCLGLVGEKRRTIELEEKDACPFTLVEATMANALRMSLCHRERT